ncbi:anti-sigma F factor [Tyzzerella sp. An114]|uniref:anti-sigma F factor n=1 Tax=Tyzzerella sp. An114 TaxID=1965545 RepID=UPI000B446398|nr:anti-sigma F factor [Tyzzerella sp. An114]OUQ60080.1 anti-sigma F factor [Tyzzerella sp. An114]
MNYENKMKLSFNSDSRNEAFARIAVSAFIMQLDPTLSDISDIKTSVSEAVTNAIIHGYEGKEGIVELFCGYVENTVYIEITDKGKGIENIEKARTPLFTTKIDEERSGMGFTVMETFMDTVTVESEKGVGTKVTMTKKIDKTSSL